jgi:hypothetical protein
VGLKNEHGLYKIHTEVSPTQLVSTELLRNIMPIFDACTGHEPDTFLIYEEFENWLNDVEWIGYETYEVYLNETEVYLNETIRLVEVKSLEGAKEELTKAFKVQKLTDEIASRLKEELSHIVKECFKNEVEKKLDSSTRESIVRSALYNVINKV